MFRHEQDSKALYSGSAVKRLCSGQFVANELTHCGLAMSWRQRSGSTLAQVMACCLTAPSHYLNQC